MVYEIVFVDGTVLTCFTDCHISDLVRMMFHDDLFIVRENNHPDKVTYIKADRVSHFRFPKDAEDVGEPY